MADLWMITAALGAFALTYGRLALCVRLGHGHGGR